jgi:acyl carrier protein
MLFAADDSASLDDARRVAGCERARPAGAMIDLARAQVFELIQAHLADELDVDADAIAEATRFKEDLEADSLDLYTLVQELEDTYGVRMSDEQAAQILTVGQAVDFVLAQNGTTDAGR